MRNRLGAAVTATLVLTASLAGVALAATETVADAFSGGGYGGSTGSMDWATHWEEVGESDGPGGGAVQVQTDGSCSSGPCLTIEQLLGGLSSIGAMRSLDLSGADSASLTYHIDFPGGLLLNGRAVVDVRVGEGGWSSLKSHSAGSTGYHTVNLPVGDTVTIRFRAVDLAVTASMGFDDVEVEVTLPDPTTTTTTSSTTMTTSSSTTTAHTATTTTTTTDPTISSAPSTTEQGDGPATSPTAPAPVDRDRPSADPDSPTTTAEPSAGSGPPSFPPSEAGEDHADPAQRPTTMAATDVPGPESQTDAVVTDLDPGLGSSPMGGPEAQGDLLVVFGLAVEDIVFDILASAVLGLVLAWASLRRLH